MPNVWELPRDQLLDRFVSSVSYWAEYTNLYNMNVNENNFSEESICSQITGLWTSSLEEILNSLNYRRIASAYSRSTPDVCKISFFASTCILISFDCCDNHATILKDIARILFTMVRRN